MQTESKPERNAKSTRHFRQMDETPSPTLRPNFATLTFEEFRYNFTDSFQSRNRISGS